TFATSLPDLGNHSAIDRRDLGCGDRGRETGHLTEANVDEVRSGTEFGNSIGDEVHLTMLGVGRAKDRDTHVGSLHSLNNPLARVRFSPGDAARISAACNATRQLSSKYSVRA